jgi:hypothetical protein
LEVLGKLVTLLVEAEIAERGIMKFVLMYFNKSWSFGQSKWGDLLATSNQLVMTYQQNLVAQEEHTVQRLSVSD